MTVSADIAAENVIRVDQARELDILELQIAEVTADGFNSAATLSTIQDIVAAATVYKTSVDRIAQAKKDFIDATPGDLEILDTEFNAAELLTLKPLILIELEADADILRTALDIVI